MLYNDEIRIEGRVHHVGFRWYAQKKALELNLTGYVRNAADGSLLVVAEGDQVDLDTLADYLRIGPPMARITALKVARSPFTGSYGDFVVKY